MAILFFEDFEEGLAPTGTNWLVGDIVVGTPAVSTSPALVGTYSLRVGRGGQNADEVIIDDSHGVIPSDTHVRVYMGFWVQVNTAWPSAGNTELIGRVVSSGSQTAGAKVNETGGMYLLNEAGSPARLYFQLVLGRKEWVEIGLEQIGAGGIYYRSRKSLWVNGTLLQTYDGDSIAGAQYVTSAGVGNLNAVTGKFNWDAYYDNIIVSTTRVGTGLTIQTVRPNAEDGTENEFTDTGGGAADVDDIPPNTITIYNSTTGATNANAENQLWSYGALTATGTVLAVQPMVYMKRYATGSTETASLRWKLPSTGTVDFLTIDAALETTIRFHRACDNLDPDGAAWTKANADALLVGAQRGASATAYALNLAEAYKSVLFRDVPQDWGGVV